MDAEENRDQYLLRGLVTCPEDSSKCQFQRGGGPWRKDRRTLVV